MKHFIMIFCVGLFISCSSDTKNSTKANTELTSESDLSQQKIKELKEGMLSLTNRHKEVQRRLNFLKEQKENPEGTNVIREYMYDVAPRLNTLASHFDAHSKGEKVFDNLPLDSDLNEAFSDSIESLVLAFDSLLDMTDVILLHRIERINEAKKK